MTQPFFATEQFSGIAGKDVSLKDALDGCERILNDEFKDYPESALYMIGAVDEAKEKAKSSPPDSKGSSQSAPKNGARAAPKPVTDPKPNSKSETPKPGIKPQPEMQPANGPHAP